MIHQVYLNDCFANHYALDGDGKNVMNKLKGRPENIAFDTSVENFLYIKMNCVGFFNSFDLSEIFGLSQLDRLVPFEVKLYVLFKVFN